LIDDSFLSGSSHGTNINAEQQSQYEQVFSAITERMAEFMSQGLEAHSPEMQKTVDDHYNFILQFWKPDRNAYKSLALSYVVPSEYHEHYENVAQGLGTFIYEAVVYYADNNLK
jgi:hypothetical protein